MLTVIVVVDEPPVRELKVVLVSGIINILLVALLFVVFALGMNMCHTPSMVPYVFTCSMSGRIGMRGRHVSWSGLRGYNVFGDMDPHDSPPFPLYWGLS